MLLCFDELVANSNEYVRLDLFVFVRSADGPVAVISSYVHSIPSTQTKIK